jgi:hypothetical protein
VTWPTVTPQFVMPLMASCSAADPIGGVSFQ